MGQAGRTRQGANHQELRGDIIRLRREGLPVDYRALAEQHNVSQRTVKALSAEVRQILAAAAASDGANRRTVQNFDGTSLRNLRRGGAGLWLIQEQLGKLAGVSRGEIGHLERGQRKPTIRTLVAIADALGVEPSELLLSEEPIYGETLTASSRAGARHRPDRLDTHDYQDSA